MNDDGFDEELENIRKRRLEELTMSNDVDWPTGPVNVSDGDFEGFVKKYPTVIVDCWAPWCRPCLNLVPVIDDLAKKFQGKVAFGKMNVDENQKVPMSFGIQSIPTLLFFKNGEFVTKQVGAPPQQALEAIIKEFTQ